eukprot:TRINITY_DN47345_c0_g1_i1.p1 TRINITY_DN47345_c0_g1~~TRINITY_DN47345_c0_g1_i1.p1  ORF type:complete len:1214 (+),score=394.62 TRINITY_DN47345_c0_g1_i1:102-3644(+)
MPERSPRQSGGRRKQGGRAGSPPARDQNTSMGSNRSPPPRSPRSPRSPRMQQSFQSAGSVEQGGLVFEEAELKLQHAVMQLSDLCTVQEARITQLRAAAARKGHMTRSRDHRQQMEEQFVALRKQEKNELMRVQRQYEEFLKSHQRDLDAARKEHADTERDLQRLQTTAEREGQRRSEAEAAHHAAQATLEQLNRRLKALSGVEAELHLTKCGADDREQEQRQLIQRLQTDLQEGREEAARLGARAAELKAQIAKQGQLHGAEHADTQKHRQRRVHMLSASEQQRGRSQAEASALQKQHDRQAELISQMFPSYREGVPDAEATHLTALTRDDPVHESSQQSLRRRADLDHLRDRVRERDGALTERSHAVGVITDCLQSGLHGAGEPHGPHSISPSETLLSCFPDPCRVGDTLTAVVTTCNHDGCPATGLTYQELRAHQLQFGPGGAVSVMGDVSLTAVAAGHCSTFSGSCEPTEPGRAGFRVTVRGVPLVCSARVVPADDPTAAPAERPALTVSCAPHCGAPGQQLRIVVVQRDPETLLPLRDPQQLEDPLLGGLGLLAAAPAPRAARVQRNLGLYRAVCTVPPRPDAEPGLQTPDFAGVEASCFGAVACCTVPCRDAGGPGRDDCALTLCCAPDPVPEGGTVTAWVTPRDAAFAPAAEEGAEPPDVTPVGTAGAAGSLRWDPSCGAYVCSFTAAAPGRAGVTAHVGNAAVTRTVSVIPNGHCVPSQTQLRLSPSEVAPGDSVRVSIVCRDAHGHLADGPEPTALRITPLGAATAALPVSRVQGSLSSYETKLRTAAGAKHASAGCVLDFSTYSATARVQVGRRQGTRHKDPAAAEEGSPAAGPLGAGGAAQPPLVVQWAADPVAPLGEAVALVVCPPEGGPGAPAVHAADNCSLLGAPQRLGPAGAACAWQVAVRVGPLPGSAAITAAAGPQGQLRAAASVTVADGPAAPSLEHGAARLRDLARLLSEQLQRQDGMRQENDQLEAQLRQMEEDLHAQQQQVQSQSGFTLDTADDEGDQLPPYALFGILLSDGVTYGTQWETAGGARVVEILDGGPVHQGNCLDGTAAAPGDIVTTMAWEDTETGAHLSRKVAELADFRRVCREIAVRTPPSKSLPEVVLTFCQGGDPRGRTFRVSAVTERTSAPPGRSAGVRKHPPKQVDLSASPYRHRRGQYLPMASP